MENIAPCWFMPLAVFAIGYAGSQFNQAVAKSRQVIRKSHRWGIRSTAWGALLVAAILSLAYLVFVQATPGIADTFDPAIGALPSYQWVETAICLLPVIALVCIWAILMLAAGEMERDNVRRR